MLQASNRLQRNVHRAHAGTHGAADVKRVLPPYIASSSFEAGRRPAMEGGGLMGTVTKAVALCNNEVAFIAWDIDAMIPDCLGFDIVRVYPDTGERKGLATWVPFEGQDNGGWKEQDTGVWPVQKTSWRDLTLRRRRDQAALRPDN